MRRALILARRGLGCTSPNPMVGAVLARNNRIIGQGWHRAAGQPHAEVEAIHDAQRRGQKVRGATLYVTLEPCCTHGRTPPCTETIIRAGIRKVVVAATDPNPAHNGRAFKVLRRAGIRVITAVLAAEATELNAAFNHWIVHRTPFVTVKAAMTLDGKIATRDGESKWITSPEARAFAMELRRAADAILVGVNTVLQDDPALTFRGTRNARNAKPPLRRIVLDSMARTPLRSRVLTDEHSAFTTIVVGPQAPARRIARLSRRATVLVAPGSSRRQHSGIDLRWLLRRLGRENVTHLLVEGGGEVNASFLFGGFAHRIVFFYAPKVLGGRDARRAVAGTGISQWPEARMLKNLQWSRIGPDLLLQASVL
ncbi:MAG TPA: bifunctional diaminohydroxyphosphoribosylaminopyrimidine deaminase/5-amino-6-(5-phosphoribosylamino)uracil reductase RibD [Verrucomicrobia bacterium]|nr:bifunctional diaminohydroxyphosphoribosylaminopyrimidine deaminase/5-amino-6-(5-phosphoribosylamino)uracil reductase RibD [Verrucomicrobiota bacterium]